MMPKTISGETKLAKAELFEKKSPDRKVTFQFNPTAVSVSHACTLRETGLVKTDSNDIGGKLKDGATKNLSVQDSLEKLGITTLRISNLVFDGKATTARSCGQLLNWSYAIEGSDTTNHMTDLIFSWGEFRLGADTATHLDVTVTRVEVVYERFTSEGVPVRAKVALDLRPTGKNPMRQNPTSGGVDLRSGHTVVSGDTLAGIASRAYGSPSQWRSLAKVNRIEDPLRIRPGDQLAVLTVDDLRAGGR